MAGSPYASSLGRLQSQFPSFLSKEVYATLVQAKDLNEVTKTLEGTIYGPEIGQFAASYKGPQLLELAVNRTFVRRNRQAYEATPFAGKLLVSAFLRRWDIQNLGLILSSKAQNRPLQETEVFLVSA
ncbi:MAG TPA: V-type ATPase subunit, partial [Thermoplasmata archaeon]|nr:V-type ATPase subunit [Thermoplasmata archaeon]